ncbi:hypothetical protein ACS0TY_013062 [Phlomoides rotata]
MSNACIHFEEPSDQVICTRISFEEPQKRAKKHNETRASLLPIMALRLELLRLEL